MCDALADEERPRFLAVSGGRQDRIERVLGKVDRNVRHVGRKRPEPLLLHVLGGRMVRLEDSALRDLADSMGPAVEAGAQDHNLLHALAERLAEAVVDVPSPDRYRSARAGPGPVDERPRHASAGWESGSGAGGRGAARSGSASRETAGRRGRRRAASPAGGPTRWLDRGKRARPCGSRPAWDAYEAPARSRVIRSRSAGGNSS